MWAHSRLGAKIVIAPDGLVVFGIHEPDQISNIAVRLNVVPHGQFSLNLVPVAPALLGDFQIPGHRKIFHNPLNRSLGNAYLDR
jgi:hypothetical protein